MPETPGLPGSPSGGGIYGPGYWYMYGTPGTVWRSKPLTTEQKGVIIAASTLAAGPAMLLGRAGLFGSTKLAHLVWKARFATVPYALSPGGGGPGLTPTSTEGFSYDYRHAGDVWAAAYGL